MFGIYPSIILLSFQYKISSPPNIYLLIELFMAASQAFYESKNDRDVDLSLEILKDTTPPYPIEQKFKDLSTIEIFWNEKLDKVSVENVKNYSVSDLDKGSKVSDKVTVGAVKLSSDNTIALTLKGVTEQKEEHYKIEMKNIKDSSGNTIAPSPKSVTAVQRIKKVVESAD